MLIQLGAVVLLFMGFVGHLCVEYRVRRVKRMNVSSWLRQAREHFIPRLLQNGVEAENFCNGKQDCIGDVCDDGVSFNSEIMATGYALFAAVSLIAVPAILRHRVPYEVFYGLHHLFIA